MGWKASTAHRQAQRQAHRHIVCFGHVMAIPYSDWLKSVINLGGDKSFVITLLVFLLH